MTVSAAIVPPAPTLFSTITDWCNNSLRGCAMMRETMSVPPPAPKPTNTRIGRSLGHSADTGATATAKKLAASAAAVIVRFMIVPPLWRAVLVVAPKEHTPTPSCQPEALFLVLDWIAQDADALDLDLDSVARLHPNRVWLARMTDA